MSDNLSLWADSGLGTVEHEVYGREAIVASAFEYFRRRGFPVRDVPVHVAMQEINDLAAMSEATLRTTAVGYCIPDRYHPHRYAVPVQRRKIPRPTPMAAFLDDATLRSAIEKELATGNVPSGWFPALGWVLGVQAAANFRPGFAASVYRRMAPANGNVLDCCMGFGGRLIGWVAANCGGHYLGIDPSLATCAGNERLAADLSLTGVQVVASPVEDLRLDAYDGVFDFAFTCPPYWRKEHYADEPTQSFIRYQTFPQWVGGFLRPMLERQARWIKPGALTVIVVADVRIAYQTWPLVQTTLDAAVEVGLELHARDTMPMPRRPGRGDQPATLETMLVFQRGLAA